MWPSPVIFIWRPLSSLCVCIKAMWKWLCLPCITFFLNYVFCSGDVAVLLDFSMVCDVCLVCVYLQLSACELQAAQSVFTALKLSLELLRPCSSLSGTVQLIPQCTHAPHITLQRTVLHARRHTHTHGDTDTQIHSYTSWDEVKEGCEQIRNAVKQMLTKSDTWGRKCVRVYNPEMYSQG